MQELESRAERRFNQKYESFLEKKYDDEKIDRVKAGFYILLGCSFVFQIVLLALAIGGVFENVKVYLIANVILPVPLFLYIIVFHDFASIEEYDRAKVVPMGIDRQKARIWASSHFNVFWSFILIVFELLQIFSACTYRLQCYRGAVKEWMVFGVVFLILLALFLLGIRPKKIYLKDSVCIVIVVILMSMCIKDVIFFCSLKASVPEKVLVQKHYKTTGKNTNYYADVLRENGESLHLKTTSRVYKAIEENKDIYLCFQEGAFDTTFMHIEYGDY